MIPVTLLTEEPQGNYVKGEAEVVGVTVHYEVEPDGYVRLDPMSERNLLFALRSALQTERENAAERAHEKRYES